MPPKTAEELKQLEEYREWAVGYQIYMDSGSVEQCANDKQIEGYNDALNDENLWAKIEANRLAREKYVHTF